MRKNKGKYTWNTELSYNYFNTKTFFLKSMHRPFNNAYFSMNLLKIPNNFQY